MLFQLSTAVLIIFKNNVIIAADKEIEKKIFFFLNLKMYKCSTYYNIHHKDYDYSVYG